MPLSQSIFNTFFRSNGMMLATIFGAAFGFQVIMDNTADKVWHDINRGRLWVDIKHKYIKKEEEDEE